ncbi:MAG: hypothetical protein J0M19_12430 [Sphingomonadales bacterium]|nr:hypothetical protein [Sphingomonadales bacterium]
MIDLADRALRKLRELQFNRQARAVLATAPVKAADDGVILFSMIGTRVVVPYLVAAKSLHAQLQRGRFVILDDGTLTAQDRAVLAHHLDRPEIRSIASVSYAPCPQGGCWERLLTLLELRREAYVIQLDSDTVTLGPVPEVAAAIDAGRDFTLRGGIDTQWLPVADYAEDPTTVGASAHIQARTEGAMAQIAKVVGGITHYTRGCAGFAGFAPGGHARDLADRFSVAASELLGSAAWAQWGSEQVMSNVIVANEGEPVLLPYDRYLNFWNEPVSDSAAFVHYVGTYRFHRGAYSRDARAIVDRIGHGLPAAA